MLRNKKAIGFIIGMTLLICQPSFAQDLKSAIKLTESEQFESAHKAFDALIAATPNNGDNYYYYGECWIRQFLVDSMSVSLKEVTDQAIKYFNLGIEKDAINPLNFIGVGRVDILLGKTTEGNLNLKKAKDLIPLQGMNYKKNTTISVTRQALVLAKIAEAKMKDPARNKDEMLEYISNAIERDAKVPEVYMIKGDIYLEYNDGSGAIIAYMKAYELDSLSCKAMVKIGQISVRGRDYEEALKNFKKAIEIDPAFAPAYRERAELYSLANQWGNAVKDYEKFLELSGNNTYAKYRYASFLFMAKKYEEALQVINEVLAIDKSYIILYRLAAYSDYELGKYTEGLTAMGIFFKEIKPEKIIVSDYIYYGDLLVKTNSDALAIEKYNLAFKMDTTNCDLLSKIAKSYQKLKDYENAIKVFQKKSDNNCLTLNDNYEWAKIYYNNALTLLNNKDTTGVFKALYRADTLLGTVISKKPDFYNAVNYRAKVNISIDTAFKLGTAVKWYNALLQLALKDSVKYAKDIYSAYDYIRFYYYKQYLFSKKCEDAKKAIEISEKILLIDPKDPAALETKKGLKLKCPY